MMGFLYVDKPVGITSHDVVAVVRRGARTRRVGHAGTLDPFATGLVVVAVGMATRLLPYIAAEPKVYDAEIVFGAETDTDDRTGDIIREAPLPDWSALPAAMQALTGVIDQVPPAFSAKHVDGQRAYALARRGTAVSLAPVAVTVHGWELLEQGPDRVRVRIRCAGGTYIRALARDLGVALHSAAHCTTLRRLASGPAQVTAAVPLADVTPGSIAEGQHVLRSPLELLPHLTPVALDEAGVTALSFGRAIPALEDGAWATLLAGNAVVAIAERQLDAVHGDRWQPRVVLQGASA